MLRIVYTPRYNIHAFGLERLHPFDARKYGRAWRELRRRLGRRLREHRARVPGPVTANDLLRVHTATYLGRLRQPAYLAQILEVPPVARLPRWLIDRRVLRPMRWATAGTVVAAREALRHGLAVNLGGGYHHAEPDAGGGFCAYADAAIAVATLRDGGAIPGDAAVVHVDLDAHQGNGVSHCFMNDRRAFLFDVFNESIYPSHDAAARRRVDHAVPLPSGTGGAAYLDALRRELPRFLDGVLRSRPIALAIFNAGTDVLRGDPLGRLDLTAADVLARDRFALGELRRRGTPSVMLTSGGYTSESYALIANTVAALADDEPAAREGG